MEAETVTVPDQLGILARLVPAIVPVLFISIGYIDPGKWVAAIEGGAHFGCDLAALALLFNFAAILCQYLSARIGLVSGRDLAQICSEEYDKYTCIFLGVQAELSMIMLDITMVLGIAQGINGLFGVDLSTGVFIAAFDAVLFPVFSTILGYCWKNSLCIYTAGVILLAYVLGVLVSQPEISFSMTVLLAKLNGESAFALMSLLGASILPHNFYLHSSIVQNLGQANVSKSTTCHDHLLAITCIFSGIYLVNYVLMNAAANVFYSTGIVLLTLQDALSLGEQVLKNAVLTSAFLLVMILSNQITASSWNLGGRVVLHGLLSLEIPDWLHRGTVRILAMVPTFYCVWTAGAEGVFQLLICTQVVIALLLPSSVIPLFRVASSRAIMGVHKISQFLEFVSLVTFMGVLGLKIVFVIEMIFGNSEWVSSLKWDGGSSMSLTFLVLLVIASASFSFMLWLAATPLKSASSRVDAQVWNWESNWEMEKAISEDSTRKDNDLIETKYLRDESLQKLEISGPGKAIDRYSDTSVADLDIDLPETILESEQEIQSTLQSCSDNTFESPVISSQEKSLTFLGSDSTVHHDRNADEPEMKTVKVELDSSVDKNESLGGGLQTEKDDDEGDSWEPEELPTDAPGSTSSLASDGPPSFRSIGGKGDEGGNGTGSLSRLAGLGRAARRQVAAVLDEFWGQLYDFHGQPTKEARAKKVGLLLGMECKPSSSLKMDSAGKEYGGNFSSGGSGGIDSTLQPSMYGSPKQSRAQSLIDSSFGYQKSSSSLWSNHMQHFDAYSQNTYRNADTGERRYHSLRAAPSPDVWDSQPATVHGYQIASYLNRVAKDQVSDSFNRQMGMPMAKSPSVRYQDTLALAMRQKLQNAQSSALPNLVISRNISLQPERSGYDGYSPGPADSSEFAFNAKKYHSLPDISGLSVPLRDLYMSDKNIQRDSSIGYGSSYGRANYGTSIYSNSRSSAGAPPAFDELSLSKGYTDALSVSLNSNSYSGSLWSRQPFEQFGVADKSHTDGSGGLVGTGSNLSPKEGMFSVDSEAKLLRSLRLCLVKLLKLEGSDWLFRQNDGSDEELIDRVAAREKFLYEAETREINQAVHLGESQYFTSDRKHSSAVKNDEAAATNILFSSVPNCGEGCIWKADLVISFGVWCIHRILDLSLMESRPELWGKYTYVLNRLQVFSLASLMAEVLLERISQFHRKEGLTLEYDVQGVIDPAFSKPRSPMVPCFCLQIPASHQQRINPVVSNGMLPPTAKPGRGKCTTAATLLDLIKDVEIAISCRKGRTGTAAGDVAFPKGKENLASVLKRYKRRLSSKAMSSHEGSGSRKALSSAPYGL